MRSPFRSKFRITQGFGENPDYYKRFGLLAHEGIDIVPTGKVWDVLCLENGIVVKDEDNSRSGAYGIYVTIWHPSLKKATQYCHLKSNLVSLGERVEKRQKIGVMGSTGNVTGAHVHLNLFQTSKEGYRLNRNNGYLGGIDPLPFLESEDNIVVKNDDCEKRLKDEIRKKNETWQWGKEQETEKNNRIEQVSRLKEQLLKESETNSGLQTRLINIVREQTAMEKTYKGRIAELQSSINEKSEKIGHSNTLISEQAVQLKLLQDKTISGIKGLELIKIGLLKLIRR